MNFLTADVQLSAPVTLVLSVIAGSVLPLAFAPFDQYWIAPLSYAALFFTWRNATPRQAFGSGFAYGLASFLAGMYWVYISVHDFGLAPVSLSVLLTIGLVALLALFIGAAGWMASKWFTNSGTMAWFGTLPALWVLTEWCRGWMLTGFGWLSAGYSQTDSWLMAYAPLLGQPGMSWMVMLSAGAIVALLLGTATVRARSLAVLVLLWGVAFAFSNQRWTEPKGQLLSVALVQGAVPQDLKWQPEQLTATLQLYRRLSSQSRDNQIIVWPEAAIPVLYQQVSGYLDQVAREAQRNGAVVLLGILRSNREPESFQNTLVALTNPPAFYVKRHLVPFGEYFPVPDFVRSWMRLMSLPYTDIVPGDKTQPLLQIAGEKIAVSICYEDVFGAEQLAYLRDATLLVNVSNDAWFGDSIAPPQHLQIARVRAAEVGRYLLRSTNTGITAVIDPSGRIVAKLPQFEPGVLEESIQGFTGLTPYARWGNYPVVTVALLILVVQLLRTKFKIRPGT